MLRGFVIAALALFLGGCATLPDQSGRTPTYALRDTSTTRLGLAAASELQAHPGNSAFRPLWSGVDALIARIALADAAQRSLDVQYYIWHNDLTGRHFAYALLRAADRGVRVRVLLDDVGARANDETLLSLDAHPNIEIRLFNPVAARTFRGMGMVSDYSRVNRRMHNKAFVADNQAAIVGGRNIGDEYFEASGEVAFGDMDVLTVGPVVGDVSSSFDQFWNSPASYPIAALLGRSGESAQLDALRAKLTAFIESQRGSPYVLQFGERLTEKMAAGQQGFYWGKARLLYDDPSKISRAPENTEGHLLPQFADLNAQTRHDLLIVSPYFIPGKTGVAWLRGLVARGVHVTILTNSLAASDVAAVHAGYQRYREALLESGVVLYELKPSAVRHAEGTSKSGGFSGSQASLHAKTFVFDRRMVFIGSLNLDPRSIQLNTEIGVVCDSAPMAEAIDDRVESNLDTIAWRLERVTDADGRKRIVWIEKDASGTRQLTEEPGVSAWRKFSVWFLGLFPIESQL